MRYLHDTYIGDDTSRIIKHIAEQELPSGIIIPRLMGQVLLQRVGFGVDPRYSSLIQPSPEHLALVEMSVMETSHQPLSMPVSTLISPNLERFQRDGTALILDTYASLHKEGRQYAMMYKLNDQVTTPEEHAVIAVSYTTSPSPRDGLLSRMPSSA